MGEKLIKVANFNINLNATLRTEFWSFPVYRSKGLLTHLIKRKHYTAAKYIDYLSEIIEAPDYAGYTGGTIELVKVFKDNIFVSIKLDESRNRYYVATVFDVKMGKIESYLKSGRLKIVSKDSEDA